MRRVMAVRLECGCVQMVRLSPDGQQVKLGRRTKACGPGGIHDGMRWPAFWGLLEEALWPEGKKTA